MGVDLHGNDTRLPSRVALNSYHPKVRKKVICRNPLPPSHWRRFRRAKSTSIALNKSPQYLHDSRRREPSGQAFIAMSFLDCLTLHHNDLRKTDGQQRRFLFLWALRSRRALGVSHLPKSSFNRGHSARKYLCHNGARQDSRLRARELTLVGNKVCASCWSLRFASRRLLRLQGNCLVRARLARCLQCRRSGQGELALDARTVPVLIGCIVVTIWRQWPSIFVRYF